MSIQWFCLRTAKALIRAVWAGPSLSLMPEDTFSDGMVQIILILFAIGEILLSLDRHWPYLYLFIKTRIT